MKNIGENSINKIVKERINNGSFESIENFCERMDSSWINKRILESLIKSGSFDEFVDRGSLLDSMEKILLQITNHTNLRNSNQSTMFDLFGDEVSTPTTEFFLSEEKTEDKEKILWEKVGGFNEKIKYQDDYDFWLRLNKLKKIKIGYINQSLYNYRKHKNNMSKNFYEKNITKTKILFKNLF